MYKNQPCSLCGMICPSSNYGSFDARWYECPRCGVYGISRILETNIATDTDARFKAAMVASERRIRNMDRYVLSEGYSGIKKDIPWIKLDEFLSSFPSSAYEMIERSLLNLSSLVSHPSNKINLTENDTVLFFSTDVDGLFYVLRQMHAFGWVTNTTTIPGSITIEAKGWQKVDDLTSKTGRTANQAFVAMWFDETMQEIYEKGIAPAVEQDGTKPVRIDQLEHNNKICDQIIAEIKRSRYLIADFTGNRGGVYFEAGFAQGLGLPVIWIIRDDDLAKVHFDTRQYNHIVYKTHEDLREKLTNRIAATIPTK